MSIEDQLKKLKIKLPNAPAPVGSYAAFKKVNNLVFISGQISIDEGGKILVDRFNRKAEMDLQTARRLFTLITAIYLESNKSDALLHNIGSPTFTGTI